MLLAVFSMNLTRTHSLLAAALTLFFLLYAQRSSGAEVELSPLFGKEFTPGAWHPVLLRLSHFQGAFTPRLQAKNPRTGAVRYTCALPQAPVNGNGEWLIPLLTGDEELILSLIPPSPAEPAIPLPPEVTIHPATALPSGSRVWAHDAQTAQSYDASFTHIRLASLPTETYLYESLGLLVLGDPGRESAPLRPEQAAALWTWTEYGGITLFLADGLYRDFVTGCPDWLRPGPEQPFFLDDQSAPAPRERRCGLGRVIRLGGNSADLALGGRRLTLALRDQRLCRSAPAIPRLNPALYHALADHPTPPRLGDAATWGYAAVWALLSITATLLLPRCYAFVVLAAITAAVITLLPPVPDQTTSRCVVFTTSSSRNTQIRADWFAAVTPFPGRNAVLCTPGRPFTPLCASRREMNDNRIDLLQSTEDWTVTVHQPGAGRIVPQLFHAAALLPARALPSVTLGPGELHHADGTLRFSSGQAEADRNRLRIRLTPAIDGAAQTLSAASAWTKLVRYFAGDTPPPGFFRLNCELAPSERKAVQKLPSDSDASFLLFSGALSTLPEITAVKKK